VLPPGLPARRPPPGDRHARARAGHVVDELGDGAAANLADAHDLVADRVEDGLDPAVEGLVATDQDGQLARACPRHAPADRGVQDADPPLRVYIMNAAVERRRAAGAIHVDGAP